MSVEEMVDELRQSYAKLEAARESEDVVKVSHALGNFLACAEVVARRSQSLKE